MACPTSRPHRETSRFAAEVMDLQPETARERAAQLTKLANDTDDAQSI
jgi:hypothetical protein